MSLAFTLVQLALHKRSLLYWMFSTHKLSVESHAGATAFAADGQNLTSRIIVCPMDSCIAYGCPQNGYSIVGLKGCNVDVNATIGTRQTLQFMVWDQNVPAGKAVATRTIEVRSPCASTEVYCPSLSQVRCFVYNNFVSAELSITSTRFSFNLITKTTIFRIKASQTYLIWLSKL